MTAVPCDTSSLRRLTGRLLSALTLPALLLLGGCLALRGVSAPSAAPGAAPPVAFEHQAGAAPPSATPAPALPASALPLAAVFAPWYGYAADGSCQGGVGSYHWNNDPNMAGVVDQPEPDFYCSGDPAIIHWQLDQLADAGVQALFVSWWGWGDIDLDGASEGHPDAYLNLGIQALLTDIITAQRPISVSLIVEPFVKTQADITPSLLLPAQRAMVLDWLWANYYGREEYRNLWFQWDGKPLLLAFDPMTLTAPLAPTAPVSYTVCNWTGCARQEADQEYGCAKTPPAWDWFFGPPQDPVAGLSDDGVAFVTPRFDEYPAKIMGATYITWTPRSLDPLLTQCAYERQWQQLAEHRDRLRLIVLYAWNLYGEQAYIEPALATPPRPSIGRRYVERTRAYYAALLAGRPIIPASYCAYLPQVRR
jgi:hypothetical protein